MPITIKTDERIRRFVSAWETLRPNKSFAGMTLEQFKAATQPAFDARTHLANARTNLKAAQDQLQKTDELVNKLLQRVVNSVRADAEEGEDSDLYEALGYVRKSERKNNSRKRRNENGNASPK